MIVNRSVAPLVGARFVKPCTAMVRLSARLPHVSSCGSAADRVTLLHQDGVFDFVSVTP